MEKDIIMKTLIIYLSEDGVITELNWSCQYTYMFLGLLFFAIAMGGTLMPTKKGTEVKVLFIIGIILELISIALYFINK